MTWRQYALARQYLAEEEVGKHVRGAHKTEKAKFDRSAEGIRKTQLRLMGK